MLEGITPVLFVCKALSFSQPLLILTGVHQLVLPCVLVRFYHLTKTSESQWFASVRIYFHAHGSVGQL